MLQDTFWLHMNSVKYCRYFVYYTLSIDRGTYLICILLPAYYLIQVFGSGTTFGLIFLDFIYPFSTTRVVIIITHFILFYSTYSWVPDLI